MHRAAGYASLETLKLLVSHGGRVEGSNLVAHASWAHTNKQPGRIEVIRYLLDQGAPIDVFYMDNSTRAKDSHEGIFFGQQNALHFAVGEGTMDMVELLLEKGADRNVTTWSALRTDWKALTPVELARKIQREDIALLLES